MRAVLCGYYGKGNGGDEALLASLLQMLPQEVTPLVLSGNPKQTRDRYGVESCDRKSAFPVLRALRHSDFFIWGGGSLMQDVTSFVSPFYYGGLMALAQQQGLQTIAWAQGIGPLKSSATRWLTRQVLQGCVAVSVRDNASAQLLAEWNIPCKVAPDPVWALNSAPVTELKDLLTPRVAVCLRQHPSLTPQRLANLTQALIEFQKASSTSVLLIPFQPAQDSAIAQTIANQLPHTCEIITLTNPRQLKGLFQKVDMVIGMRYHSLIMAAAEACRCFALSYDPKVSQLMRELNLPGWELNELPNDPHLISQTWLNEYQKDNSLDPKAIQSIVKQTLIHQELLSNLLL